MTTRHSPTDEEWLDRFESGEIEFDPAEGHDRTDLAEVRAFELLRREYEEGIVDALRLTRHRGVSWHQIGAALGMAKADAVERYLPLIEDEAERAGAISTPEGRPRSA